MDPHPEIVAIRAIISLLKGGGPPQLRRTLLCTISIYRLDLGIGEAGLAFSVATFRLAGNG